MMLRGLVLAAALMSALADIPVHCVHRDILGTWELMMGESDGDSSATCGHVTPDRIMTMVKHNVGPTNPRFTVKRTLTVEFKNPNVVVGPEGRQGVWTTVYDEGFDIELDGWNYFSFFRYSPKWQGASPTKAEEFNWHCDETVSGWYHLGAAPRGKSSHSWGCFVARRVSRSVPLDSEEYAPEEVKKRGGMVSGEMVLSATVMTPARFAEAGLQQPETAANADGIVEQRTPVAAAAFAAAEAADGGRASVDDSLSHLLGGGEDAAVYGREGAGAVAFLETMAASTVTSDEAIRGLESREAAQAVVDRINADADAGLRMWRAEVPQHLLGISHDEARKRLGASSKDVRASVQEAKRAHRVRVAAGRSSSAQTGSAAAQAYAHAHAHGSVRANRRLGSRARAHTPDLSPQFGRHAAVAIDASQYPTSLDWSQVAGGAYIPDVLDQGHCGSCYAAAATDAITARARIKAKGQLNAFTLSTQSVVQCSGHNQGCDGGYPYLVGKFGHEIGFVPAECMQYTGKQDLCPSQVACPQLAGYLAIWTAMGAGKHGEASLLQHSASQPAHSNFLQVEEAQGGRGASRLRGEDAVVAALQAGAAAGSEGHVKDGGAAGPLGFAVHPHQIAVVSGERQLPQFRQHGAEGRVGATSQSQMEADAEALAAEFASDAATDAGSAVGVQVNANGDAEGMIANTYALDERLYISRYGYVGGYYGAGSESAMIKELQDGPLVVALNAPGDLFYYKGGIYHHDQKPEAEYDVTPISRFEKTNHAVMLVGYGEETVDGQVVKYWKLKNSWGKRWGEARDPAQPKDAHGQKDGGYFRMVRGTDCLAAESMAVVIDP